MPEKNTGSLALATPEWQRKLERFRLDPRYRIENLYWIITQDRETIRLNYNEAQVKLYSHYKWFRDHRMPVRLIICKARRAGLSTGVESLIFDDTVTTQNTTSLIVGNQHGPAANVMDMCKTFWEKLPYAVKFDTDNGPLEIPVRPPLHRKYNNVLPKDRIEFDKPLSSRIFIASAKSIDAYRSYAFQNIHATEAAYYDDASGLFTALTATVPDKPHTAIYIESTPNGMSGNGAWFYEQCISAHMKRRTEYGDWRLVFIPWHEMIKSFSRPFDSPEERRRFELNLKQDEKDLLKQYSHLTLEQLKWRRARKAQPPFNKDDELFDQEFPSDLATAFLVSGTRVFTAGTLKSLMMKKRPPVWEGDVYWGESDAKNVTDSIYNTIRRPKFLTRGGAESEGYASHTNEKTFNNLRVWQWPKKGDHIVLGCDVGRGNPNTVDGDYSTICVVRMNGLEQDELIMTWRGKLNVIAFGDVCAALAWGIRYRVGDKVVAPKLVIEWTGPGTATCTHIDERHLYDLWRYRMPGVSGLPPSKHIGWESNGKTKPFAVGTMVRVVEQGMIDIPDEDLIIEMSSYRQHGSAGFEDDFGSVGTHDDLVSSFQIALAVCRLDMPIDPLEAQEPFEVNLDTPEMETNDEAFDEFENKARTDTWNLYGFGEDTEDADDNWWN